MKNKKVHSVNAYLISLDTTNNLPTMTDSETGLLLPEWTTQYSLSMSPQECIDDFARQLSECGGDVWVEIYKGGEN